MEGGGRGGRKSQFREQGKDERWHQSSFNEGNLEYKALHLSCTEKQEREHNGRPSCARVIVVLRMYAPLGPYGGVNTVTYPGHLIQIRR